MGAIQDAQVETGSNDPSPPPSSTTPELAAKPPPTGQACTRKPKLFESIDVDPNDPYQDYDPVGGGQAAGVENPESQATRNVATNQNNINFNSKDPTNMSNAKTTVSLREERAGEEEEASVRGGEEAVEQSDKTTSPGPP